MTTAEARERIKKEFMDGFYEWLKDEAEMPDMEYGRKYGYGKGENPHKDDLKGLQVYTKYFGFSGYGRKLEDAGYDMKAIWELKNEGFLSYTFYSNWQARQRKMQDWFYISQRTAKEIYKEAHSA